MNLLLSKIVYLMDWSFWKYKFTQLYKSCKSYPFHDTIFLKITIITITTDIFRNVWKNCKDWETVKLPVTETSVPEFWFSLESLDFIYHWSKISSVVPLKWQFKKIFKFIFKKISSKCPRLNNQFVCKLFSRSKNGAPWKKQGVTSIHTLMAQVPGRRQLLY